MTELSTLNVTSGSVVILRGEGDAEKMHGLAQQLQRTLYARGIDGVLILILDPATTLEALTDEDMLGAGWVRTTPLPVAEYPIKE